MIEITTTISPEVENTLSLDELFAQLLMLEPKPITNFVPTNAAEQKALFLSGDISNPDHTYGKLDAIDYTANYAQIRAIGEQIINHPDVSDVYVGAYNEFVQNYEDKTTFIELAHRFNHADAHEKEALKDEYMQKNIELFGEPDESTYRSLLSEKLAEIKAKEFDGENARIRDELFELIGSDNVEKTERFRPSDETVAWIHEVTVGEGGLYSKLLEYVPEKELFNAEEIKAIFEEILIVEFGEILRDEDNGIMDGWKVVVGEAQKINLKTGEKIIAIPADRELEREELRDRIVHEIGVHYLRYAMGEQTDLLPFKLGFSNYLDTEEGMGSVMEQARVAKYREAGVDHYITAGLSYFEGKDFREVYEIKWRLDLLADDEAGPKVKSEAKSQDLAYTNTMRFFRGTDELPWFKDLSYYNGAAEVWKYLESIKGDDLMFMFLLLGKGNPANAAHRSTMLETATV